MKTILKSLMAAFVFLYGAVSMTAQIGPTIGGRTGGGFSPDNKSNESTYERKTSYWGFNMSGGMCLGTLKSAINPDIDKLHNSVGWMADIYASFDWFIVKTSPWYIGMDSGFLFESPYARYKNDEGNEVRIRFNIVNMNYMFGIHFGQHFDPKPELGYGNFYWKAGVLFGAPILTKYYYRTKTNGEETDSAENTLKNGEFQLRPFIECGIGAYEAKFGLRYAPAVLPMYKNKDIDQSCYVHNISIVLTCQF